MTADGDVDQRLACEKKWLRACRLLAGGVTDPGLRRPEEFFFLCLGFFFSAWILNWFLPHGEYVRPERARAKRFVN